MASSEDLDSPTQSSSMELLKSVSSDLQRIAKTVSFSDEDLEFSPSNDLTLLSDLRPSLADQIRSGYFSMDRACQTEESDIIDLKETTALLATLVGDVEILKSNLYYAKLALQADYDAKIESRSLELHKQATSRIKEIQKIHEEKVKVVRHSFRTQLADAIKKISIEYHKYYTNKEQQQGLSHQEQIDRLAQLQANQEQDQLAQQQMIDMMQMQLTGDEMEEQGVVEVFKDAPFVSEEAERHAAEMRSLTDLIAGLEEKVEEFADTLNLHKEEKQQLLSQAQMVEQQLNQEQTNSAQLKENVLHLKFQLEKDTKQFKVQMGKQKDDLQKVMDKKMEEALEEARVTTGRTVAGLEEAAKLKEKNLMKLFRMKEEEMSENAKKRTQTEYETAYLRLKAIEEQQRIDLIRLQKELEKSNKAWELRVTILQQTIHALKDEMFIRHSLQRQSAKLQHAAVTYVSNVPTSAEAVPTKAPGLSRKYQLPSLIRGPGTDMDLMISAQDDDSVEDFRKVEGRTTTVSRASNPSAKVPT